MSARYDVTIIGGGIVGLATAWQLLREEDRLDVLVLEKEDRLVLHQSSHNSGVLHSGIYYPPGSLKAILCMEGRRQMVTFCDEQNLPCLLNGKYIVARGQEEELRLHELLKRGRGNGLDGLRWCTQEEIRQEEPEIRCSGGIWVPQAGITDYGQIGNRLGKLIEHRGGKIHCNRKVNGLKVESGQIRITTTHQSYYSRTAVNCAGLYSDRIARMTHTQVPYRIIPFRGEYYRLDRKWNGRIKSLIYPTPDPDLPFLGIHLTQQLDDSIIAGPNAVLALAREGYSKSDVICRDIASSLLYPGFIKLIGRFGWSGILEMRKAYFRNAFVREVRRLLPDVSCRDVTSAPSGVRAQAVSRNGELIDDFLFLEKQGIIHVCNAPSPAATASLAIGRVIAQKVLNQL